jgi:hypothetical protein
MPGNIIKINNSDKLSWYVGDSKLVELMEYLNKVGHKESQEEE